MGFKVATSNLGHCTTEPSPASTPRACAPWTRICELLHLQPHATGAASEAHVWQLLIQMNKLWMMFRKLRQEHQGGKKMRPVSRFTFASRWQNFREPIQSMISKATVIKKAIHTSKKQKWKLYSSYFWGIPQPQLKFLSAKSYNLQKCRKIRSWLNVDF